MTDEIIAVVGPTAAGKTAVAVRLAEAIGAEVVSCDSMQVYRELDIGTAKPTAEERARVPHHVIDVVALDEDFSAARYVAAADAAIAGLRARGRRVVIVGGTGLYLRALRFGLVDAPSRDEALRARLYAEEAAAPGRLHARLREVDPVTAARLPPRDLVRIVRALEVHELTGEALGQRHAAHAPVARYPLRVFVLDPPADVLQARIAARVDIMLAGGLVDETRRLVARYGDAPRPLHAVGYHEILEMLGGRLRPADLVPAIARATRQYARRQRTWFKKEPGALRIDAAEQLLAAALR